MAAFLFFISFLFLYKESPNHISDWGSRDYIASYRQHYPGQVQRVSVSAILKKRRPCYIYSTNGWRRAFVPQKITFFKKSLTRP